MAEQPRTGFPLGQPGSDSPFLHDALRDRPRTTPANGFPGMASQPKPEPVVGGSGAAVPASPSKAVPTMGVLTKAVSNKEVSNKVQIQAPSSVAPSTSTGTAPPRALRAAKSRKKSGDSWWERVRFEVTDAVTSGALSERLIRASSAVEAPITTGRRIVVLGTAGGATTTTVAALLAKLLGSIRQEPVMTVDATDQGGNLLHYLGASQSAPLTELIQQFRSQPVRTFPDAVKNAASCGNQVFAAGRADVAALADAPLGLQEWTDVSSTLSRFMAVTVVDGGASPLSRHAAALLGTAHAVVLVAPSGAAEAGKLASIQEALTEAFPDVHQVAVVVRSRQNHDAALAGCILPYDRHLASGGSVQLSKLGSRTRIAATELAGKALMAANRG
ncbi:MinD/ParA family protein [Paenarthrobacter sp. NPDC092416]|uniref:MinD/ParA family ATP-binding protein n=1 Tax=Paenarthrobacter sp. NPDC092416 TaxID=3364386 RepID=UPI00380E4B13